MSEPFARFAETAERVRATPKKLEKMRSMADFLSSLDDADLAISARFFAGTPFPRSDERVLGTGWSAIADIALELSSADGEELGESYQRHADLGDVVADLFAAHARAAEPPPLLLGDAAAAFAEIAATRGAQRKRALLAALLRRANPAEAKYLVKLMTGEMRIGLREGLLEDAIARATGRALERVQRANMLTGDIGETAVAARHDRLDQARFAPFHAIGYMLAAPVLELAEVAGRFPPPYLVEDKYDGMRVQVHTDPDRVELYSRTLDRVTPRFPELREALRALPAGLVLDGEVLGWRGERPISFVEFQRRLGRKTTSEALLAELPAVLFAFDLLVQGGEVLLDLPLAERRRRLATLELLPPLYLARSEVVAATGEALSERLAELFAAARERGNEGLMVKDPRSPYRPGRRGMEWLKVKRPLRTLDVVVTGVEWGHGKRRGVLSDYTFGVREDDRLLDVGKAYSGLTDAEIAQMTRWFLEHTIRDYGRYRAVEPTVVIEVAFDNVQRSDRHPSGYALRFPRIVRLRPDKRPEDADTLESVRALAKATRAESSSAMR